MSFEEIVQAIPDREFLSFINRNKSLNSCIKELGYVSTEATRKILKDRIRKSHIDISHFPASQEWKKNGKYRHPLNEILVVNSDHSIKTDSQILIQRLVEEGLKEYKCEECSNPGMYNGRPLRLQLHHKNGHSYDNRLENLAILCPNCHSQTETFAGKNAKRVVDDNDV